VGISFQELKSMVLAGLIEDPCIQYDLDDLVIDTTVEARIVHEDNKLDKKSWDEAEAAASAKNNKGCEEQLKFLVETGLEPQRIYELLLA
jgi:predicted secreted acid phosphatase